MCRGALTRYINRRLRKSRVNFTFSARAHHQKAGLRAIAHVVPRAGVVNARRPGLGPGRSGAKSIDDTEHGTRLERAMVQAQLVPASSRGFPKQLAAKRADAARGFVGWVAGRNATTRTGMWAPHFPDEPGCTSRDTEHGRRWRERPRLLRPGPPSGHRTGVVHAIAGSPDARSVAERRSAKSAARSIVGSRQIAPLVTLLRRVRS